MLFISLSLLFVFALLFKFLTSDGDFTLISKKHVKREEIEDKVVWITGASRGIGEVLAKQLASLGAKLIISSRHEAELDRVKDQLTGKHAPAEVKILPLDLASGEYALKEAVDKAESFFSGAGVDYMIHNAAYERPKTTALVASEESLKATFNINVLGTISLTRLLAPSMLRRGRGHFVVHKKSSPCTKKKAPKSEPHQSSHQSAMSPVYMQMSSAAGKTPAPGQAVYSASKFALNGYFHSLRSELYQKGIKVTVVCPGPIETSNGYGSANSGKKGSSEKRVSSERCAELTIIAVTHALKEVWISHQVPRIPVLMYKNLWLSRSKKTAIGMGIIRIAVSAGLAMIGLSLVKQTHYYQQNASVKETLLCLTRMLKRERKGQDNAVILKSSVLEFVGIKSAQPSRFAYNLI